MNIITKWHQMRPCYSRSAVKVFPVLNKKQSFTFWQIVIKYLLCARYHSRLWNLWPKVLVCLLGETDNKQINEKYIIACQVVTVLWRNMKQSKGEWRMGENVVVGQGRLLWGCCIWAEKWTKREYGQDYIGRKYVLDGWDEILGRLSVWLASLEWGES